MPTMDELIKRNKELEALRNRLIERLSASADSLREASTSFILEFMESNPEASTQDLLDAWENTFHVPQAEREKLKAELDQAIKDVGDARTKMYGALGVAAPTAGGLPYENLVSAMQVDFPRLQNTMMNGVRNRLQAMIATGAGSPEVEDWLRKYVKGNQLASTLTTTAFAQFDNAYTFQIARQAGIDRFMYMGQPPEREFCRRHLGNTYTRKEIEGMDNGHGLAVMTSCGGYNCRHMWVAVPEDAKVTPSKPSFTGQVKVLGIDDPEFVRGWRRMFRVPPSRELIANLCGAPDNSIIDVTGSSNIDELKFTIVHAWYLLPAERQVTMKGRVKILHNNGLILMPSAPDGLGTSIIEHQVKQADAFGIDRIETLAAGKFGEDLNGYYSWPRMGFDADIPNDLLKDLPDNLRDARRLSDLMKTEEGADFWKKRGSSIHVTLDIDPQSVSRIQHELYIRKKGVSK